MADQTWNDIPARARPCDLLADIDDVKRAASEPAPGGRLPADYRAQDAAPLVLEGICPRCLAGLVAGCCARCRSAWEASDDGEELVVQEVRLLLGRGAPRP